jgi:bifunctional non-homologous end joining protein LigD
LYNKTIRGKTSKRYTEESHGVAFSSAAMAGRVTGFVPQLLNEISPEDARNLGPDWLVQEKHDGERRGMIFDGEKAVFANRKGLEVGVQTPVQEAFNRLGEIVGQIELDAEDMGGHVVIFDVKTHFTIGADAPFRERAAALAHVGKTIDEAGLGAILRVDIPVPADRFFAECEEGLRKGQAEGFVLRHEASVYSPGRPASGGQALKVKYWDDVTCRVGVSREGKRSVGVELLDGSDWRQVGNVTIPANAKIPEIGTLIDVRYLYATPTPSLFQPGYLRPRPDVDPAECTVGRLKFKREDPENDSGPGV